MVIRSGRTADTRESQLQFLRFLAFLNVFILHIGNWRFMEYPAWNSAVSAVTFFFMLSGVLAGFNAYGRDVRITVRTVGADLWKKFKKIYPLHFLTTCFSVIYTGLPGLVIHDLENAGDALMQLTRNILLLQAWVPKGYFSYNGVSWYLSALLFLYLLNIPLQALLVRIGKKENHNAIFLFLMGVLLLATVCYSYLAYRAPDPHFWQYVFPPARIGQYGIGMIAGYMLREQKEKGLPRKAGLFTAGEILALLVWTCTLHLPDEAWYNRLVLWIFPNLYLIGVFLLGQGYLSKLFRFKPLVRLGDVSFECYLLHECIIYSLSKVEPVNNWGRLICIGMALCYTLLIAFFINSKRGKNN